MIIFWEKKTTQNFSRSQAHFFFFLISLLQLILSHFTKKMHISYKTEFYYG